MIPLAALIGLMFVVSEKTFEWANLRLFGKIPTADVVWTNCADRNSVN